jgi:hypothetical protein
LTLSPASAFVAARSAAGDWADLSELEAAHRTIPAAFIRQLVLGQPLAKSAHDEIERRYADYARVGPTEDHAPVPVPLAGVRVRNATIVGSLDLTDCGGSEGVALPALALEDCVFEPDPRAPGSIEDDDCRLDLDLSRSRIARLSLRGSQFGHVRARESVVDGSVDIAKVGPVGEWSDRPWPGADMSAFLAALCEDGAASVRPSQTPRADAPEDDHCMVDLTASRIGGDVIAEAARLRTPAARKTYSHDDTRYALALPRAVVGGSLVAYGGTVFDGGLMLHMAEIRGGVWLGGATLIQREGASLEGQSATFGEISANDPERPLRAFGAIYLHSATIHRHLQIIGARLDGDGASALYAHEMSVGGDLLLLSKHERPFAARGPVRLRGSRVGGFFNVAGACIDGKSAQPDDDALPRTTDALDASFMRIELDACLAGIVSRGSVLFRSTHVGGELTVQNARLDGDGADAFDGSFTHVHSLVLKDNNTIVGPLRLTHASAAVLDDNLPGYGDPATAPIELDGFRYDSLHECDLTSDGDRFSCALSRIAWLSRRREYQPQPYTQLASVLARQGRKADSREVLIAKLDEDLQRRRRDIAGSLPWPALSKRLIFASSWLFSRLFGYGLDPTRAIRTIFAALLIGWLVVAWANWRGAMVVDQQPIAGAVFDGSRIGAARATDAVYDNVPCADSIEPALYALDVFIPLVDLRQESKCEVGMASGAETELLPGELQFYRLFKALYAVAGWLIVSLAILTFSGVLQRRREE